MLDSDNSKIYPSTSYSERYTSAELVCNSDGYGLWFFEKRSIPPNTYTNNSVNKFFLHFKDIHLNNYGTYFCFGWDAARLKYFLAESYMIVYGKLCN